MWTDENRGQYDRKGLRYPSDLTHAEWEIIAPLIPLAKRGGDKRTVVVREVVNGLMYILGAGCQSLPAGHSQNAREGGGGAEGLAAAQQGERLFPPLEP